MLMRFSQRFQCEQNVVYGANIGIITQAPALEELTMDVYTPEGDEATDRRVVVLLHTGTFLPAIVNGQATGDKSDNTLVELCTRLARKVMLLYRQTIV